MNGLGPTDLQDKRVPTPGWWRNLAWHWVGIVVASVAGLLLFAKVGEDVFEHESTGFDDAIRAWILTHQTAALFGGFLAITYAGSAAAMIVLSAAIGGWLWRRRHRRVAAAVVTAPAMATGLFVVIKGLFHRVRPIGALKLHLVSYSFPSGHATASTAVLVTAAYVLVREELLSFGGGLALAVIGPLLVGMSRVYLDVHWATDVLGGWCLGFFVAALSAAAYEWFLRRVIPEAA